MIIVKIFALTYALIPSLYFKADFRIIRLLSTIYSFYKVFLFDIKQGTFRLFHFKNAYERDILPRNSSLQSSDIDKKDQNVFKKFLLLFEKLLIFFKNVLILGGFI